MSTSGVLQNDLNETGVTVHLSGQWPEAYRQGNTAVASAQASDCPSVPHPRHRFKPWKTSVNTGVLIVTYTRRLKAFSSASEINVYFISQWDWGRIPLGWLNDWIVGVWQRWITWLAAYLLNTLCDWLLFLHSPQLGNWLYGCLADWLTNPPSVSKSTEPQNTHKDLLTYTFNLLLLHSSYTSIPQGGVIGEHQTEMLQKIQTHFVPYTPLYQCQYCSVCYNNIDLTKKNKSMLHERPIFGAVTLHCKNLLCHIQQNREQQGIYLVGKHTHYTDV